MSDPLQNVPRNLRIVGICTLVSRIFGLLRDQAMSRIFGAGWMMDSFTVAFRLPNLARTLLGEGALTTAFLPVFLDELNHRGRESAGRVTWAVFIVLASALCSFVLVSEGLLWLILSFCDLSQESRLLCVLTSILFPYVILICLAAQLGGVLNALGHFVWPALVPVVLNLGWLAALWFLVPLWTDATNQIYVTSICVVIAGSLQLVCLLPVIRWCGFGYRSDWRVALGSVKRVVNEMIPVVIGLSITQVNSVVDSFIAWSFSQPPDGNTFMPLPGSPAYPLNSGTATALYLGQRLYQFPLGVFGVALGTVLFPLLTRHAQLGESDKLRNDLSLGVRLVLAIGLPASVGLMLVAQPLSKLFFQYGKFDAAAANQTGNMILWYGSGVWAYCGLLILQRGFYATGDRITPMYTGLGAVILNVILNLTLIWPLGGQGLALSTAVVAAIQVVVTCWLLQRRIGPLNWPEIGVTTAKTFLAVGVMSVVCLCLMQLNFPGDGLLARGGKLLFPLAAGVVTYFGSAWLLRLEEPWLVVPTPRRAKLRTDSESDRPH